MVYPVVKQIFVVSDGLANEGGDPMRVAAWGKSLGVTVHTIGLVSSPRDTGAGMVQIKKIAQSGGGMWELVFPRELVATMQTMATRGTHKAMEVILNRELQKVLGIEDWTELPPEKREPVAQRLAQVGDECHMKCILLLDISGSMGKYLPLLRNSACDLLQSWAGRRGQGEVAVLAFPHPQGAPTWLVAPFTAEVEALSEKVAKLACGGRTPLAPALQAAILMMNDEAISGEEQFGAVIAANENRALLGEYLI